MPTLQKLNEWTLAGTSASFADMGIPAPTLAATFATAVEVLGGAALIIGLLTPVAAVLNMVSLLGALVLVHAKNGVFVGNGGFELVLALLAGLVIIAMLGAGRPQPAAGDARRDQQSKIPLTKVSTVSGDCRENRHAPRSRAERSPGRNPRLDLRPPLADRHGAHA